MGLLDRFIERSNDRQPEHDHTLPPTPVTDLSKPKNPQPVAVPSRTIAARQGAYVSNFDAPLLQLSDVGDTWTVENAAAGTLILGSNGSGKTTGSGQTIAKAFLQAGFGGLVLCAKPDEAKLWERYAKATGRKSDLIIVRPDSSWRFNFVEYELHRPGDPATRVENLISTFMNLMEAGQRSDGGGDAQFWYQAAETLLRNSLMVLVAARRFLTPFDILKFINALPTSAADIDTPAYDRSDFAQYLEEAKVAYQAAGRMADYEVIANYFRNEFPRLADRTRSSVTITLSTMLQDLLVGTSRELFATTTNFFPDDTHEGAIIVLDLPTVSSRAYATAQKLFKTVWQQAAIRRQFDADQTKRPVFLWVDEAHLFATEYDAHYQSLARSAKACSVFLTQNISNYINAFGAQGEAAARGLLGLLQTQVFHAQSDPATLNHIIQLFGKTEVTRYNETYSRTEGDNWGDNWSSGSNTSSGPQGYNNGATFNSGHSRGYSTSETRGYSASTTVEDAVFASEISSLKNGSDTYSGLSAAFLFRTAHRWNNGSTILYTQFNRKR